MDSDMRLPQVAVTAATIDPDMFLPHQLEWFAKVVKLDLKYYGLYLALFASLVWLTPAQPALYAAEADYQVERVVATLLFAAVGVFTLWVDIFKGTPAEPGDRKWHLMLDGIGGHFCYLTINILTSWAVYWPICLVAEVAVWLQPQEEWAQKTHLAMYSCAVFSSSLGTLLTLLFLKFNWFEPNWRREVLDMYDARGNKTFRKKILFTHLNQLPIAFVDVALLKRGEVLKFATPSFAHLLAICFAYTLAYISFTHFNYRYSKVYPYTFMDVVLKTWTSELVFLAGLTGFCFLVGSGYHFLAYA